MNWPHRRIIGTVMALTVMIIIGAHYLK